MMNFSWLQSFVANRSLLSPEALGMALDCLRPYADIAASGLHQLAPMGRGLCRESVAAIRHATGCRVKRIIPVSLSAPFPKADWMTVESHRFGVERCVTDLEGIVNRSLGFRLPECLPIVVFRDGLLDQGDSALIRACLWEGLSGGPWNHGLWQGVRSVLYAYLFAIASGNADAIARLSPLVRLMPHAVPQGNKAGDKTSWLLLVR